MGILSIIGTIIVGFIVGVLARWIFPARFRLDSGSPSGWVLAAR